MLSESRSEHQPCRDAERWAGWLPEKWGGGSLAPAGLVSGPHPSTVGRAPVSGRPCSSWVPEPGAAARQLDGREAWSKAAPLPRAAPIHYCGRREGKEHSEELEEADLLGQVWVIGKTFLLIPAISTQRLNEENGFSPPPKLPHTALAGPTGPSGPSDLTFPGPSHKQRDPGDSFSVTNQPVRPARSLGLLPGA